MINIDDFKTQGYFTHSFTHLSALTEIKQTCESIARKFFGDQFTTLDKYHEIKIDSDRHEEFQYAVFNQLNNDKMHRQFVTDNLAFFTSIFQQFLVQILMFKLISTYV